MDTFAFEVAETARVFRRAFDRRAAALGVTRAQWRVLAWLARESGMRQVELADRLDIEPITLCRMVDRLADAELVERRKDEHDRRAWRLHLTAKAHPIVTKLHALADDLLDEALDGISVQQRADTLASLARVRANLSEAPHVLEAAAR